MDNLDHVELMGNQDELVPLDLEEGLDLMEGQDQGVCLEIVV